MKMFCCKEDCRVTQGIRVSGNPGADAHAHDAKYPRDDLCDLFGLFTVDKDPPPGAFKPAGVAGRFQCLPDIAQENADEMVFDRIAL